MFSYYHGCCTHTPDVLWYDKLLRSSLAADCRLKFPPFSIYLAKMPYFLGFVQKLYPLKNTSKYPENTPHIKNLISFEPERV